MTGGILAAGEVPGWDAPAPPAGTRWAALAVGDFGNLPKVSPWLTPQRAVGDAMAATHAEHPVAALLLLGDTFYPDGLKPSEAEARIDVNLIAPFCAFLDLSAPLGAKAEPHCPVAQGARRPVPVLSVLGNHDWNTPESPDLERDLVPQYVANWKLQKGGAWVYETPVGVSLVLFDSTPGRSPEGGEALRAALAQAKGPWRVVVSHHPVDDTPRTRPLREAIAAAGVPVQLWLAGHEHNLQIAQPGPPGPALMAIAGGGSHATGIKYEIPGRRFYRRSLGYARLDLVPDPAAPGSEELVVSLVAVRPVPAALWDRARVVARWAVARDGGVRRIFQDASEPIVPEKEEEEPFE